MAAAHAEVPSPLGSVTVAATARGVVRVTLPGEDGTAALGEVAASCGGVREDRGALRPLLDELDAYFAGRLETFSTPVDWTLADPAAVPVLEELRAVPYGTTVSYGELAQRAGMPGAARVVGRLLSLNPVPIVVPCHRVIGADHRLTGFAGSRHAVEQKAQLLALEGATLPVA
jgi:methylated-DNA-[protein]-cysteine S-methyltransferase